MRTYHQIVAGLLFLAAIHQTHAQPPVINSFSQNGVLVCSNLVPGSTASVQWASSLAGPWQSDWNTLSAITVGTNGAIQVSVPMYYRVLGGMDTIVTSNGMALVQAGSFTMGDSVDGETDAVPVTIYVSAFYMDTNLVTLSLWQTVYNWGTNAGYSFTAGSGKAANHPVQQVTWYGAVKWCNARSQMAGLTPVYYTDAGFTHIYTNGAIDTIYPKWAANGYRLPTEAEWEKAARGKLSGQRFPWGNTISEAQANYYGDPAHYAYDFGPTGENTNFNNGAAPYTSPVNYFPPNGYGMNDMAGNVFQWIWDWYAPSYGQPTTNNPTGPASGTLRSLRGGFWDDDAYSARTANRDKNLPNGMKNSIGLRCVKSP